VITTIFAKVKETLHANLAFIGDEQPSHELGSFHLSSTSSAPNIVWELVGGIVSAARQSSAGGRREIRQIGTRHERCRIHVWGEDFAKTEVLMNHFCAAAREACTSGFAFREVSTNWQVGQDQRTALGRLCILEVEFDVPVTAEPLALSKPPHHLILNGAIVHPS
jgi:hypothetical protein